MLYYMRVSLQICFLLAKGCKEKVLRGVLLLRHRGNCRQTINRSDMKSRIEKD